MSNPANIFTTTLSYPSLEFFFASHQQSQTTSQAAMVLISPLPGASRAQRRLNNDSVMGSLLPQLDDRRSFNFSTRNRMKSPLLRLPPDLRNMIWEEYLRSYVRIHIVVSRTILSLCCYAHVKADLTHGTVEGPSLQTLQRLRLEKHRTHHPGQPWSRSSK